MHSKGHVHHQLPNACQNPIQATLTLIIALLFLMLQFLFIMEQPVQAQSSVPPTAVQAAKMPQFAARLGRAAQQQAAPTPKTPARFAHPTMLPASFKNSDTGRPDRGPLDNNDIYDNGPINGNTDAWTINFGFIVSDSFNFAYDGTTITGMTFAMWLFPGDTLTSAELSITSGENGGTSYFDQTVNFTQGSCTGNVFGFNICTETTSFNGPILNNGTYWVNLQNASVPSGDPIYWDENSGLSSASENGVGSIPSESFTVLGNGTTTSSTSFQTNYACPPAQSGLHDLHDFASHSDPSGVVIDSAGKLYGTLSNAGNHGAGLIYEFAQRSGHWLVSTLYSFLGGSDGGSPDGVIVGPQGDLYGAAVGGIQTCGRDGASYCGLIYQARPGPAVCAMALCSWEETTIYQFTGNSDAWNGHVSAYDAAGNLYGVSSGGGAHGAGAVFQLTPSPDGWTEKILYSFTGGSDGGGPNSLLIGHDGNLYGTTTQGGNNSCYYLGSCGVVFQLTPSGSGWTENVLHAFTNGPDGAGPGGLIEDSNGNLYGYDTCYGYPDNCAYFSPYRYGLIFKLWPSGGGWMFNVIYDNLSDCGDPYVFNFFHGLTLDAAGNLYAAEGGSDINCDPSGCYEFVCGRVVAVGSPEFLVSGNSDIFHSLTSDANGKLYGTTDICGFGTLGRTDGMVWQYSP